MGAQRNVRFPAGHSPDWPAVAAKLAEMGKPVFLRMIDDLPAFPDEEPDPDWQELRVALAGGMVTLRRTADGFAVVTWGDQEPALVESWDDLSWAVAAAGGGTIDGLTPDQFRPPNR